MKRILICMMAVAFMCAMAATPVLAGDMGDKLSTGAKTFFMSPKHIPDSISEEYEAADFKPLGVIGGTVKGISMTVLDLGKGLFHVVTSPLELMK